MSDKQDKSCRDCEHHFQTGGHLLCVSSELTKELHPFWFGTGVIGGFVIVEPQIATICRFFKSLPKRE